MGPRVIQNGGAVAAASARRGAAGQQQGEGKPQSENPASWLRFSLGGRGRRQAVSEEDRAQQPAGFEKLATVGHGLREQEKGVEAYVPRLDGADKGLAGSDESGFLGHVEISREHPRQIGRASGRGRVCADG